MLYSVTEIFYSIQGEGYHAGRAAVFIRLAGCNYSCEWCDTNFQKRFQSFEDAICARVNKFPCDFVVITGGEPTIHDLVPLLKCLKEDPKKYVAIETNGTNSYLLNKCQSEGLLDWITVSPKSIMYSNVKFPFKKAEEIRENIISSVKMADEVKIVLDGNIDPNSFLKYVEDKRYKNRLYIQPLSEDMKPALDFVLQNPMWKLSIQLQKILKVS